VDDSDGIYLKGVFGSHKRSKNEARRGSLIQDCTFAHGADDAIDINGDDNNHMHNSVKLNYVIQRVPLFFKKVDGGS